jgi:phosphoribosylaminoimidazolecarboxamide formyltransferase / IMP cyclohydrolase
VARPIAATISHSTSLVTIAIRRALLSVSNKEGLTEFARDLQRRGVELLSTGGTAHLLEQHGITVKQVSAHTGFPEIMNGRVKTLHPRIHGGLLGRRGLDDAVMQTHGIEPIDLLVVNLYPFAATIAQPDCSLATAIENIDIGGPAMVRAAAKNHAHVTVLVDPADYAAALNEIDQHGALNTATRARLAAKAFAHTASYDATVADYLAQASGLPPPPEYPATLELRLRKRGELRYGENPHQSAALYTLANATSGISSATQLQGRTLSYNNIADGDTAWQCVQQFSEPACVIVKHANPCGVALGADALSAYVLAYRTDPTSAYGGIIAFNRPITAAVAEAIFQRQFVEVLVAPHLDADALRICAGRENVRVLTVASELDAASSHEYRSVGGGLLVQSRDTAMVEPGALKVVTRRQPQAEDLADLLFAWRVCKFVKSNAIVYARSGATLGIGAGQMSRVVSSRIAAMKAGDAGLSIKGAAMASDAFFPFRDGVDVAAEVGIGAVIQPGGSVRDQEVIAAADQHGMTMVLTGMRHFRH